MKRRTLVMLPPALAVAGCGAGADRNELEAWMAQQRSEVRPAPEAAPAVAVPSPPPAPGLATLPDPFRPGTKPAGAPRAR